MELKVRTWEKIQQWSRVLRYRHDVAANTIVGCLIFHPVRFQFQYGVDGMTSSNRVLLNQREILQLWGDNPGTLSR